MPASTVRAWFKPRADGKGKGPLLVSDYKPVNGDYAVSFLDLIDVYVARFFRNCNVPLPVIRRAFDVLRTDLDTKHPFAHAELCAGDGRIIRKSATTSGATELIDVISKQKWFSEMQGWLRQLDYDELTKMATRWRIAEGVVVDPKLGFGKPVVTATGVTTFVLANQYHANGRNAELVADLFSVTPSDVTNAANFEAARRRRAAA